MRNLTLASAVTELRLATNSFRLQTGMHKKRMRLSVLTASMLTGACVSAPVVGNRLHLEQTSTTQLPAQAAVLGATGDGTSLAVWSDKEVLTGEEGSGLRSLPGQWSRVISVAIPEPRTWEVFDGGSHRVVRQKDTGRVISTVVLDEGIRFHAAARLYCGWVAAYWNSGGRPEVSLIDSSGNIVWRRSLDWKIEEPGDLEGVSLRMGTDGTLATVNSSIPPFHVALFDCDGSVTLLNADTRLPREGQWVATSVLPTTAGLLTTYSDVTSNMRVLQRRAEDGELLGEMVIRVPLALVSVNRGGEEVIAVRRTDRLEVVTYRLLR